MRAFLAIPIPDDLRHAAAEVQRRLPDGWRPAREDGLHVTVRFLGELDPARAPALDAGFRDAAAGTGTLPLTLAGVSAFPASGRPRVVWLGVLDGSADAALRHLAQRVESAATRAGFLAEDRPFAAHVTLARARRGAPAPRRPAAEAGALGAFVAERLVLYRSELHAFGSRYHEVASYPLAGGSLH